MRRAKQAQEILLLHFAGERNMRKKLGLRLTVRSIRGLCHGQESVTYESRVVKAQFQAIFNQFCKYWLKTYSRELTAYHLKKSSAPRLPLRPLFASGIAVSRGSCRPRTPRSTNAARPYKRTAFAPACREPAPLSHPWARKSRARTQVSARACGRALARH